MSIRPFDGYQIEAVKWEYRYELVTKLFVAKNIGSFMKIAPMPNQSAGTSDVNKNLSADGNEAVLWDEETINKEQICWAAKTAQKSIEEDSGKIFRFKTVGAAIERLCAWREIAANQIASLTPRQHQIMLMMLAEKSSKDIADDLGISQRTVENHRTLIMKKTGSKSIPALARLALTASWMEPINDFTQE